MTKSSVSSFSYLPSITRKRNFIMIVSVVSVKALQTNSLLHLSTFMFIILVCFVQNFHPQLYFQSKRLKAYLLHAQCGQTKNKTYTYQINRFVWSLLVKGQRNLPKPLVVPNNKFKNKSLSEALRSFWYHCYCHCHVCPFNFNWYCDENQENFFKKLVNIQWTDCIIILLDFKTWTSAHK